MSDSEIITATEASRAFSDLLHKVAYQGQSFTIKKGSRLMARIVPVDETEAAAPAKKPAKKTTEKSAEIPAPGTQEKPQPVKTQTRSTIPVSTGTMSVPDGLTSEDVDFYQDLIKKMR